MKPHSAIIAILYLLCCMQVSAQAAEKYNEQRGQLLYTTHCNVCHTAKVHWRNQHKVTDWPSLVKQVRHWQGIVGLDWNEEEIGDVAHYLNDKFYAFKDTAQLNHPGNFLYGDKHLAMP